MAPATRARRKTVKQERTAKLALIGDTSILWITAGREVTAYRLQDIGADRGRGFRLEKADKGDGETACYDVNLDGQFSSCECKGFLRHNHCKHLESLTALQNAGKLPAAI
jgi:hypothetical protein